MYIVFCVVYVYCVGVIIPGRVICNFSNYVLELINHFCCYIHFYLVQYISITIISWAMIPDSSEHSIYIFTHI